jgi:predicted enzyme related to lactoylglutathione lyase
MGGMVGRMTEAIGSLIMVNLDSADPAALAEFYHRVLGWEVTASTEDYAMISDGTSSFGFGRIEGFQPPPWPDPSGLKRYHLDLYVDDLDEAERLVVEAGGAKPAFQPGTTWRVVTDPSGQPFCLCQRPAAS